MAAPRANESLIVISLSTRSRRARRSPHQSTNPQGIFPPLLPGGSGAQVGPQFCVGFSAVAREREVARARQGQAMRPTATAAVCQALNNAALLMRARRWAYEANRFVGEA